ncbi:heavy metal-associated protein [Nitritalea halalkaliphila LW7]|uniref:Heavy metal-associated protein n=1 Tax=Nitritalea halalkaliphila LW7 TaxID=1189621 RepID=I5BTU2_9BACT|nr:heavy metal-associated protein [Nitritalea halalkaliphila]EIM72994.1 heavy metal-associated protein [Nitritalea halalkaliphila LW7]
MDNLKFKTNVKCGACVAAIRPALDGLPVRWEVDLQHPDRILSISGTADADKIVHTLKQVGYQAEEIRH